MSGTIGDRGRPPPAQPPDAAATTEAAEQAEPPEPSDDELNSGETAEIEDFAPGEASSLPDAMRAYLREISRTPLLSALDEVALGRRIQAGLAAQAALLSGGDAPEETRRELAQVVRDGRAASDAMVTANLRLVVSVARRYAGLGVPLLDLVQDGNIGLMRAVERFDPERGFKFSTYATWWVRQAVMRSLSVSARLVRVPSTVQEELIRLWRAERNAISRQGRSSDADLAVTLGMTPARIAELRRWGPAPVSLDAPVSGEGDAVLGDLLPDGAEPLDERVAQDMLGVALRDALSVLKDRERQVISLRFGLADGRERTLEAVAAEMKVTRERIRQIEARGLAKLRHVSVAGRLAGYQS